MFQPINVLERKPQVDPLILSEQRVRKERQTASLWAQKYLRLSFPSVAKFFLEISSMTQPGSSAVA